MVRITSEHVHGETRVSVELHGNGEDVKQELCTIPASIMVNFGTALINQGCPKRIARKETELLLKMTIKHIEETMQQYVKDGDI